MPRIRASILGFSVLTLAGCQEVVLNETPKNDLFGRLSGSPSGRASKVSPDARRGLDPDLQTPIREELPDGEIVLRSRTARDLMVHIQRALTDPNRELERELFTEHVLSDKTWQEYESRGLPPERAYEELLGRRDDVLLLFNRIGPLGQNSPQVIMQSLGDNVIRLQVTGLAREGLSWTFMDMILEGGNWRLRWFG
jgi:hypothetical protein